MILKNLIHSTAIILFLFTASNTTAQNWKFVKEKDGIKLYTQKVANSPLLSYRGVVEIHTTMKKISEYIGNAENTDWWHENIKDLIVIVFEKEKYIRYYLRYDLQWPVTDRDLCVEECITVDSVTGEKKLAATPLPDIIPEKDGVIRIRNYWQTWTILPLKNGMLKVTLEGFVDPAGSVPSWLYNMIITETPLKMIREIQKQVTI